MGAKQKAELLGLVERIVKAYNEEHKTLKDIEAELREDGIDISREAIRRTVKSNKSIAAELEKTRVETVELINSIRDNPATDTNEATLDFLISKAFEYVKTIESVNFESLPQLGKFLEQMTKSKTNIVNQRLQYKNVFERAKKELVEQVKIALSAQPELCQAMQNLIMSMEAKDV